uniref:Secreted protein n=1 Tax=Photinus pyralis TaxID=7054 RepID=A0A1Y1KXB1_PHOPY
MFLRVVLVAALLCGVASALYCLHCQGTESSQCQKGIAEDFAYCFNKTNPGYCVSYWFNNNGVNTVARGCEYHKFGTDVCDTLKQEKGARDCTFCDSEDFCNQELL